MIECSNDVYPVARKVLSSGQLDSYRIEIESSIVSHFNMFSVQISFLDKEGKNIEVACCFPNEEGIGLFIQNVTNILTQLLPENNPNKPGKGKTILRSVK